LLSPDNNINKPYPFRSKYEFCKSGIEFQICKENEPNQLKNQRNTQFFHHFAVIGSDEDMAILSHAKKARWQVATCGKDEATIHRVTLPVLLLRIHRAGTMGCLVRPVLGDTRLL
jgi:hypothetical protein